MIFSKPLPRIGKGQLRCFQCHQIYQAKEGNWHDHKSQQVFLCKTCERAFRKAEKSPHDH